MKQTIIAVLLLITASKGIAQKSQIDFWRATKDNKEILTWKGGSDTIEIMLPVKIHFIKIGDEVYQIVEHTPTIEKVQPTLQTLRFGNGGILYGTPTNNFNNAIDIDNARLPITQ